MKREPSEHKDATGGFEIVDHTADWSLRVYGSDLANLLMNAAIGMSSLLVAKLYSVQLEVSRDLVIEAFDAETLLVDWLSELAYFAEQEQLVFRDFQLRDVTRQRMTAHIRGGRAPELQKHIKAVTYHDLSIDQTETGLTATIVFDV
jgi:SHS2 domain-containing protein